MGVNKIYLPCELQTRVKTEISSSEASEHNYRRIRIGRGPARSLEQLSLQQMRLHTPASSQPHRAHMTASPRKSRRSKLITSAHDLQRMARSLLARSESSHVQTLTHTHNQRRKLTSTPRLPAKIT